MGQINSVQAKHEHIIQKDAISRFFEQHDITRKIVAYAPSVILGGAYLIEQFTSYKLLPRNGVPFAVSIAVIFFFSGLAKSSDRSLENKKITLQTSAPNNSR